MRWLVGVTVAVLGLTWTLAAVAAEVTDEWGTGQKIAATELFIAASASWAASNPRSYGATTALIFPFAAAGNQCRAAAWTAFLGSEAIAADSYFMDTDKHSYNYRLWRHVAAWHIFGALLGTVEYFACPGDAGSVAANKPGFSLGLAPAPQGTQLVLNYRY